MLGIWGGVNGAGGLPGEERKNVRLLGRGVVTEGMRQSGLRRGRRV